MAKFLLLIIISLINLNIAFGSLTNKTPVLFLANRLLYDYKNEKLTANGNVEFLYQKQMIYSDNISYNYRLNEVEAIGDIRMIDLSNNIIFANKLFFKLDNKSGYINPFKVRFYDNSVLAAFEAHLDNDKYVIKNATYSACPICKTKNPQWQIKAKSVTFDNAKKNITYNNAYFEIYGVPILYIPYFSHPTKDSPAKSGLLNPKLNKSSALGSAVEQPIYYRISDNKELTVSPVLNSKNKLFLKFDYNHLISSGLYNINFSTLRDNDRNRGHVETKGLFKMNEDWQIGHDTKYVSDSTYLKTYKFSDVDHLSSNIFANYVNDRNYANFEMIKFQGLNDFYNENSKLYLLPYTSSHLEHRISDSSYYFFDNNFMTLNDKSKYNVSRIINNIGHKKYFITKGGHVLEFINSARLDGYDNKYNTISKHKTSIRTIPSAQTNWSYPLISSFYNSKIFLKPSISVIYSPSNANNKNIPIEDSIYVELSDDNLFKPSKWPGFDRLEEGLRTNYAIDTRLSNNLGQLDFFLGQSYRHNKDYYKINEDFIFKSGIYNRFSDYVGRINYIPNQYFNLFYKFRVDRKDGDFQKNDLGINANYKAIKISTEYISFNDYYKKLLEISNKQLYIKSEIALSDKWNISSFGRRNLSKENKKMILAGGGLVYKGDCMDIYYTLINDFTRNKEQRKNSVSHFFNISLRNITH